MDISAITSAAASNSQPAAPSPVLSSDFETFLKMLTAQARYQDPLEPIDSTEYASQLAQFSMVEQQVRGNDLLATLAGQMGASELGQMAGWIGMEARSTAPVLFDGSPIAVTPRPLAVADAVDLIVYDATGAEVDRQSLPIASDPVEWAGVETDGTPFPEGLYSFAVESRAQGEVLLIEPVETYARVTEVRSEGGNTLLVLEGGKLVDAAAITALREG